MNERYEKRKEKREKAIEIQKDKEMNVTWISCFQPFVKEKERPLTTSQR